MNSDINVLRDLRAWFDEHKAALTSSGYNAEFSESPPGRAKNSVSLIMSSSRHISQLVVWDTGEAELSMIDIDSAVITEEHRNITSSIGLRDATETLIRWLEEDNEELR